MFNLFAFEIKKNLKSLIIGSVGVGTLSFFYMSIYPSMFNSAMTSLAQAKMAGIPAELLAALNISSMADFTDILQYMAITMTFTTIATGMYALITGGSIFAKEEDKKTIAFLAAAPIKRSHIAIAKMAAGFVLFSFFALVQGVVMIACLKIFVQAPTEFADIGYTGFKIMLGQYATGLILLSVGFFVSSIMKKVNISVFFGIFFVSYFIAAASRMIDKLNGLIYTAPTDYFSAASIISNGVQIKFIVIGLIIGILGIIGTIIIYVRKDFDI